MDTQILKLLQILISTVDPTQKYFASDTDETSDPKYYGFVTQDDGYWYIMKIAGTTATTIRYTNGAGNYPTAWTNRATLSYTYPTNIK